MFDVTAQVFEVAPKIAYAHSNCTVISGVPFPVRELKPQIMPGYFQIPPAKGGQIHILHVGESIHWMESPFPKMPPMKVTETPKAMARSIVNDFIDGMLAIDTDAGPCVFWVEGHWTEEQIRKDFAGQLHNAFEKQKRWFVSLVRIADDDWTKYRQHRMITDIQRAAAIEMGFKREWIDITVDAEMTKCPLCAQLVAADAIIHSACGYVINLEKYNEMRGRIASRDEMSRFTGGLAPDVKAQLDSIGVKA